MAEIKEHSLDSSNEEAVKNYQRYIDKYIKCLCTDQRTKKLPM